VETLNLALTQLSKKRRVFEKNGIDIDYFTIKGKGFRGYLSNVSKLKKYII